MKIELFGGPQDGEQRDVPDDVDTIWPMTEALTLVLTERTMLCFSAYRRRKESDGTPDRMVYVGDRWV